MSKNIKTFYVNGLSKEEVDQKIQELKAKNKYVGNTVGRFIGTAQYYGDIYYV